MAPGQRPGGPFNPMNRSKLLKGTGRGSMQLRNTHATHTSQCHYGRKPKILTAAQPQTAATGVKVARIFVKHDSSNWNSDLWPARTPLRTSIGASSASASSSSSQKLRESLRPSSDLDRSETLLPDEPLGLERVAVEGFLDACYEATSHCKNDLAAVSEGSKPSFQHAFAMASARVTSLQGKSERTESSSLASCESDIGADLVLSDTVSSTNINTDIAAKSDNLTDDSSYAVSRFDSSSVATPSIASDRRSVLDSYPANVVVSILCPRALSGHLIGPSGRTAASLQLPGARWWLTDKTWKFGGASNLRLLMIQGPPSTTADVFAKVLLHVTCEKAPHNSQFFKTRQGLVKAKIVLQSWLVGTVVGKGGSTIRRIMRESGAQMQVTSVLAAVDARKQTSTSNQIDEEAALQIAAPSVSAVATCLRLTFEAIRRNPCYKPVAFKSASDYKHLKVA